MANYAILSDLHGNLQALQEVYIDLKQYNISGLILLGDIIDYGMQSNEVIEYIQKELNSNYPILCNIWGNHEKAIMLSDFSCFSSSRGVNSAKYTASILNKNSKRYLDIQLKHEGFYEFILEGKKCLAVHASMSDHYWKAIFPDNIYGDYSSYDFVFSGHSHCSHVFTKFYEVNNSEMRNKHAVVFINPGSIGQPRNHHPQAQYAILDISNISINMRAIPYNIKKTQSMFIKDNIDIFYRDRLKNGI